MDTNVFDTPRGMAVDSAGNIYVADCANHKIKKITPEGRTSLRACSGLIVFFFAGAVTNLAGSSAGFQDGEGEFAQFSSPWAVAVDSASNVFVADNDNHLIRKITPNGICVEFLCVP